MRKSVSAMVTTLCLPAAVHAADCKDGMAAYIAGDYTRAVTIYQPLAMQGDACAQYWLGEMYKAGLGHVITHNFNVPA